MALTLELSATLERRLVERAKATGTTTEALAVELLDKALPREKTFDEVMAPFWRSIAESRMTEGEFDALAEQAVREARDERRARRGDS